MTLVEVMVAVLILGLTLGAGVRSVTAQRRAGEAVRRQMAAMHLARMTMEQLTQRPFYHSDLSDGWHAMADGGWYRITRIPANVANSKVKRLDVWVRWPGGEPGTGQIIWELLTVVVVEALHP